MLVLRSASAAPPVAFTNYANATDRAQIIELRKAANEYINKISVYETLPMYARFHHDGGNRHAE